MKQYYFLSVLILIFLSSSKIISPNSIQDDSLKAYLMISFQNPEMFKDSSSKNMVESEIEKIFEAEGIHIIHEEKPEEYKLNIHIQIGDSLRIEEKTIGVGGISIIVVKHPSASYPYQSKSDIYDSIRNYIKSNFKKFHK